MVADIRSDQASIRLASSDASNMFSTPRAIAYPTSTSEVQDLVRYAVVEGMPFVARGAGTGLTGGAVPLCDSLVISFTKMNRVLHVDSRKRHAWVQPGVLNADLSRFVSLHGLHFAPDPSSQQSCTIGGNVANNSGGPHCLAEGVTSAHILELEVVLSNGDLVNLGAETSSFDLRGAVVGSEGMFGLVTAIKVRLTQNPPHVSTMVLGFNSIAEGAQAVSAIIASGVIPAALEMMDAPITKAVEEYVHAGFPLDAAALLIVEIDGLSNEVRENSLTVKRIAHMFKASSFRLAASEGERALIWKGRKTAFGAIARIQPNYYLHDTVVPRGKLADVLALVAQISIVENLQIMNVFHAGDGNLHPLILFNKREPGVMDRVNRAGAEIIRVSMEAGGALSGEHGIGIEKRDFMNLMFSDIDLDFQQRLRSAFDPLGLANPHKVLPKGSGCGDPVNIPPGSWI